LFLKVPPKGGFFDRGSCDKIQISMAINKTEEVEKLLSRNVEEVIEKENLKKRLLGGDKLRVKFGIDPTAPDLHLGHAVVLRKLRDFQKLGHKVVLVIGDFTGTIGDPSGKNETRKPLTEKEVKGNMKSYLAQAAKIIDIKKTEVVYNSRWFKEGGVKAILELAGASSIQQVLKRADFKKRLDEGHDITLLEVLYSVFQGYDSLKIKASIELGGTDQKFNLLMGRRVQRHFGMKEQDVMTLPLLEGTDGEKKMSKSYGNYIGLSEFSDQMFGKVMKIPDKMMERYFEFCTDLNSDEIKNLKKELLPRDLKAKLGYEIVKIYHGEKAARAARENFDKIFSKKEFSGDLPILKVKNKKMSVVDLVYQSGVVKSKSEAWRLVEQGGFSVDGETKKDPKELLNLKGGEILRIGKKSFFKTN
jgi:tyrosyl-tRNA synthetase